MQPLDAVYLQILKNLCTDLSEPVPLDGVDPSALYRLAEKHCSLPFLLPYFEQQPQFSALKQQTKQMLLSYYQLEHFTRLTFSLLLAEKIPCFLLKGISLAANYPIPEYRKLGDLDLYNFVDNHDVTRVASILTNEKHLPLIYALMFGMPGIPCVYYGSEWGAKGEKSQGDPALRACFDGPQTNGLTEWIAKLAEAKKHSNALNYGAFRSVVLTNRQCIFERAVDGERVLVAINAEEQPYTAHFDAGCGRAVDLITGQEHDFGGGSELPGYSAYFWKCER